MGGGVQDKVGREGRCTRTLDSLPDIIKKRRATGV